MLARNRRTLAGLLVLACAIGLTTPFAPATAEGPSPGRSRPGVEGTRSRNYTPRDYARMLANAAGTVAVARRATHGRLGSGVLLARDLVLTCRHCTHVLSRSAKRRGPNELEVQLEVRPAEEAEVAVVRSFPVLAYLHTSEVHDLCVLRIGPDEDGALPEAERVRALSAAPVPLDAPIYVSHHPRGEALCIADDARVQFPYVASRADLARLEERCAREARDAEHLDELLEGLRASYRLAADGTYRNHSVRWAGQPTLGTNSLTFDGSSGAPVYDKRTHALVGILFAGADQEQARIPSTWQHHEAVLPASAVLADLARSSDERCRRLACSD